MKKILLPIAVLSLILLAGACGSKQNKAELTDDTTDVVLAQQADMKKDKNLPLQQDSIVEWLNKHVPKLTDERLKANLIGWGERQGYVHVDFILNTPEARRAFREKLIDSPSIRFEGPEEPEPNPMVGPSDTLGISLRPEYSVYADTASSASFLLINHSSYAIQCGEYYTVTYEDEQGTWRTLPTCPNVIDIAYGVAPGYCRPFHAPLYPMVHRNKPGRYRFFYEISIGQSGKAFMMMTEFRLTDNKQEVKRAVRIKITTNTGYPPSIYDLKDTDPDECIYQVVEEMPEFPGGMSAFIEYVKANIRYPESARKANIEGRVIVQFVVMEDGSIEQAHVVHNINFELDEEALRVIRSMPRWKPGKQGGRIVKVKFTVPVTFRLE